MFSVSDNELQQGDWVEPGDRVRCKSCGLAHPLVAGKDPAGEDVLTLLFYSCGADAYLGAVQQRTLPGVHLVP